jgi:hypothetical protein
LAKLAIISALLLGACVTTMDSEEVARLKDDPVAAINVIDEVELPQQTPDYLDVGTVIITGVEIPGRESTATHIDLRTALEVDPWHWEQQFCALTDALDGTDVCSSLCDVDGFIARVNDTGGTNPGSCQQHSCLVGTTVVNLDVCSPPNS